MTLPPYLSANVVGKLVGGLLLLTLARLIVRLFQVRLEFRRQVKQFDLPTLPDHSLIFGHMILMGKLQMRYPKHTSALALPMLMLEEYPELRKHGVIYLDVWPVMWPIIWVTDPDICAQFTQETSLQKSPTLQREFTPLTQCKDLVTTEGQEWKTWRSIFNPGFSGKNLTAMVPAFLEEIEVLRQSLFGLAKTGEVIELEKLVQKTTADVICRAVIGVRLESQTKENVFLNALANQVSWLIPGTDIVDVSKALNPVRPLITWNNNRIMRNFLTPHIENSLRDTAEGRDHGFNTINNLAIKAYMKEVKGSSSAELPTGQKLDPTFVDRAIAHMKMFLFAGHDTTASTISFIYWYVFQNPRTLAALRAEHDSVLGPDPTAASAAISANPHLLNQLPYTSAVIKETLRLCPPAATCRHGPPGFELVNASGRRFPAEGRAIVAASFATQQMEEYWERPREFLPERFLAREGEALYPRKNAWRPFEAGPRNCIGQELSQMEVRAILVMTIREFDFEAAYSKDAPELWGQKAYQVMRPGEITGHAAEGYPVRIRLRRDGN